MLEQPKTSFDYTLIIVIGCALAIVVPAFFVYKRKAKGKSFKRKHLKGQQAQTPK